MSNVLLAQLDIGTHWDHNDTGFWAPYGAGTWYVDFNGAYSLISSDFLDGVPTLGVTEVGAVWQDITRLASVASIALLDSEPSFYWNTTNKILYIRLSDWDHPRLHTINLGVPVFLRSGGSRAYYTDSFHEDRILSIPQVGRERDRLFFGILSFDNADLRIDNRDGRFDDLPDRDVYNQELRLYSGDDSMTTIAEFTRRGSYFVERVKLRQDAVQITAADPRKMLSQSVPGAVFSVDDYTNLADDDVGRPIPLGYGRVRKAPVTCTNRAVYDKTAAQTLNFKICDTTNHAIHAITTVYHGDTELTVTNKNTANATFDYAKAADEEISFRELTVTYSGYVDGSLIENPVDIITDIIALYAEKPYSSTNYDMTEVAAEKVGMWDCALHVEKATTLSEIIETLVFSVMTQFIVLDDGRFTFRRRDTTGAPVAIIESWEILNLRDLEIDFDATEFLSSCAVLYDRGKRFPNRDYENEVSTSYHTLKDREFDTVLVDEADADAFSEEVMDSSKTILPPLVLRVSSDYEDIEIGDIIVAQLTRVGGEWVGVARCEVAGVYFEPETFNVLLIVRILERDNSIILVVDGGAPGDGVTDAVDGGEPDDTTPLGIDGGEVA